MNVSERHLQWLTMIDDHRSKKSQIKGIVKGRRLEGFQSLPYSDLRNELVAIIETPPTLHHGTTK